MQWLARSLSRKLTALALAPMGLVFILFVAFLGPRIQSSFMQLRSQSVKQVVEVAWKVLEREEAQA